MRYPDAGARASASHTGAGASASHAGAAAPASTLVRILFSFALLVMAALAYLGARERHQAAGATPIDLSPEQEVALGVQSTPVLAAELGGLDSDPAIQRLVQEVGGRLATVPAAATSPYLFDFQVLADTRTANAFALPGGPIFITRALYSRLENEAELAGILAHEIGHVVARHSAEQIARASLSTSGAVTADLLAIEYRPGDELAADALGVELMSAAGYDPRALVDAMRLLEASRREPQASGFARAHADPGDRAARIGQAIDRRFPNGGAADLTTGKDLRAGGSS